MLTEIKKLSWDSVEELTRLLAGQIRQWQANDPELGTPTIVPIPRGGMIPGVMLSHMLNAPMRSFEPFYDGKLREWMRDKSTVIVDDICDTGRTFQYIRECSPIVLLVSLIVKPEGVPRRDISVLEVPQTTWVQFPWETDNKEWTRSS
jgi:xanthine phosphoribosyltransferase